MREERADTPNPLADALLAVGGVDGMRAALEESARDRAVSEALSAAGGSLLVAEALAAVSEAVSGQTPLDMEVAEAIQAAGGGAAIASALAAAGSLPPAAEALEAVGGEAALGALLEGTSAVGEA